MLVCATLLAVDFHFSPTLRVSVTGIYRATPLRVNPRLRVVKAVYKTYIDVVHFQKTDTNRLRVRDEEDGEEEEMARKRKFPSKRVEELQCMSRMPDIFEQLSQALGVCMSYVGLTLKCPLMYVLYPLE